MVSVSLISFFFSSKIRFVEVLHETHDSQKRDNFMDQPKEKNRDYLDDPLDFSKDAF